MALHCEAGTGCIGALHQQIPPGVPMNVLSHESYAVLSVGFPVRLAVDVGRVVAICTLFAPDAEFSLASVSVQNSIYTIGRGSRAQIFLQHICIFPACPSRASHNRGLSHKLA